MKQELDIRQIRKDDLLLVWEYSGRNNRLVLCFSGVGPTDGELPGYDFAFSATEEGENHVLYIADPNRTWLNGAGVIDAITAEVRRYCSDHDIREICTLGHSMGGFSALVMPWFLKDLPPVRAAVALAPQFSVHPEIAGSDVRWMEFRSKIAAFPIRDAATYLMDGPLYFVFHGIWRDSLHRELFPTRDNLVHTVFPRTHHNVPQRLKQRKLLDPVLSACFAGRKRRVRILLKPLHAYHQKPPEVQAS